MKKFYFSLIAVFIFCSANFLKATDYYLKLVGTVTSPTAWGTTVAGNGSGDSPANFNGSHTWHFANRTSTIISTGGISFPVGATVSVESAFSLTVSGTGSLGSALINVAANATLVLGRNTTFSLNTLNAASTVIYNIATLALQPNTYGNLIINQTSTVIGTSDTHVAGLLTLNANLTLASSGAILYLEGTSGTIAGSASLVSNASAIISITNGAAGNNGTMRFASGARDLNILEINYSSPSSYFTIGSSFTVVAGLINQISGGFDLNGNTLTIDNSSDITFDGTSAVRASGASALVIDGTIGNNGSNVMVMDATNKTFASLTLNSANASALVISGGVNVTGTVDVTAGSLQINNSGTSTINDIELNGGDITLATGGTFNVTDFNINSAGTAQLTGGSLNITDALNVLAGSMTINSAASTNAIDKITLNGGDMTLTAGAVNVTDFIDVSNAGSTFNAGNNLLTLKANSTRTARLGQVVGTFNATSITVESFAAGPTTGWAMLGVNGVNGAKISNWETQIPMTCTGCIYDPSVVGGFVSIQGYDHQFSTYIDTYGPGTDLSPALGFWVYLGSSSSTTTPYTWSFSGSPVVNNVTVNNLDIGDGFILMANPYASPISWDAVSTSNGAGTSIIHGYNAEGAVPSSYVAGGASNNPNGIGAVLPAGQGFYFENQDFISSLTFQESHKSTANTQAANPLIRESEAAKEKKLQILRLKLSSSFMEEDYALFDIRENTSLHKGSFDATKLFVTPGYPGTGSTWSKYTTISSKDPAGKDLSINAFPPSSERVNIPVLVRASASGSFVLSAQDYENWPSCVVIKDKLTNTYHDLTKGAYSFYMSDTTSAPRFELVVCENGASSTVSVKELNATNNIWINQDANGAFVKTNFEQNTKAVISAYNIIGQKLMSDVSVEGTETTTRLDLNLGNQVVIIKVATDKEVVSKKIVSQY